LDEKLLKILTDAIDIIQKIFRAWMWACYKG